MARSNYALISALYSDKSRGLYSDIYFPIIKYAIVKIYGSKKGEHYAIKWREYYESKETFLDIQAVYADS